MLSHTYTQAVLKVEQDGVRTLLNSLQQSLRQKYKHSTSWSRENMENLLCQIKHVHVNCSWRRLEVLVWPEIREEAPNAKLLMAELESLRLLGLDLYRSVRDRLRMAMDGNDTDTCDLYWTMETYCHTLLGLLDREEHELFGLAFDSIPEDKWFLIAKKFMWHDKNMLECGGMGKVLKRTLAEQHSDSLITMKPRVTFPLSETAQPCAGNAVSPHGYLARNPFQPRPEEGKKLSCRE